MTQFADAYMRHWASLSSPAYMQFNLNPQNNLFRNQPSITDLVITHYNDVIMSAMASQITSITIVYSTVYSGLSSKKNFKAPRHWPLCGEFTEDWWIPRTKVQYSGKCFHLCRHHCACRCRCKVFNRHSVDKKVQVNMISFEYVLRGQTTSFKMADEISRDSETFS